MYLPFEERAMGTAERGVEFGSSQSQLINGSGSSTAYVRTLR